MSKVRKRNMPRMIWAAAAAMTLMWSVPALAQEEQAQEPPRSQWIDMEKGPGAARWVDENGVVSEIPGVKPGQMDQKDDGLGLVGPGYVNQASESGTDEADPAAAGEGSGQNGETGAGENQGQASEEQPAAESGAGDNGQPTDGTSQDGAGHVTQESNGQPRVGRVIDPNRPMVALTFDDGPYAPVGNQIMDCLAAYGGKATFYVVGSRCASYQAEMQRMAAEGHEIGNHTYEHKYLNKLPPDQILYQVNRGSEAIQAACGVVPATMRLPGGNKNSTVLANIHVPIIMWSIDTLDWKTRNTQNTVDKVLGTVRDGDVVLMHELYRQTGDAAVQIIPALVERGFQLVTVSELAQYRGGLLGGHIYSAFRP